MRTTDVRTVVGIDIGATHSRARLVAGPEILAEATAGSASVAAEGADAAVSALDDLLGQLYLDAWAPLDAVCIGAAGTRADILSLFEERVARYTRDGVVVIVEDGFLVLPAANLSDGVGVICGTGAVAVARRGAHACKAGGWGYLLGDEGSGYWLVCQSIRAVLDRRDRGRALGALGTDLLDALRLTSIDDLKSRVYSDPRPGRWAAYAPVVLGSSDPASHLIVEAAAAALDRLVGAALEGLGQPASDLPIVLAGGLTRDARFRSSVTGYLRRARPATDIRVLEEPPVVGAVRLAQMASAGQIATTGDAGTRDAGTRDDGTRYPSTPDASTPGAVTRAGGPKGRPQA
jgi:glucosamine kinase